MRNQYSVIVVAGARNPDGARAFADWLLGADSRALLTGYGRRQTGRALFAVDSTAAVPQGEL
jgi:ABC-type Fe3+ transport system substrate-binding protein